MLSSSESLSKGKPGPSVIQTGLKDGLVTLNYSMESLLRESVRANGHQMEDSSYTFPYGIIDGIQQYTHFRRNVRKGKFLFSIDIGTISADNTRFDSKAFIDFSIGRVSGIRSVQLVGITGYCHDDPPLDGPIPVKRFSTQDIGNAAIFVYDFWRGMGLGKALKDGAVAVLKEQPIDETGRRVRFLVFDDISDLRFETQPGKFYSHIRGRVVQRYEDKRGRQRGRMIVPINVVSTSRDGFK